MSPRGLIRLREADTSATASWASACALLTGLATSIGCVVYSLFTAGACVCSSSPSSAAARPTSARSFVPAWLAGRPSAAVSGLLAGSPASPPATQPASAIPSLPRRPLAPPILLLVRARGAVVPLAVCGGGGGGAMRWQSTYSHIGN